MTIITEYNLYCTDCGRGYKDYGETKREVRKYAKQDGWIRTKDRNVFNVSKEYLCYIRR